jgi:hypothetical protein
MLLGLTAISAGIRDLKGVISNAQQRAQIIAVSIINHDLNGGKNGEPSGDVSKAKELVNALRTQEDRRNMIAFLGYFGNIGFKMDGGVCTEVQHFKPDNKRYRKADLDGAKANNWYEPYDKSGKKAYWFEGPERPAFTPGTIATVGDNILNFADRFLGKDGKPGQLDATKDNGRGETVPLYDLTDEQRKMAEQVLVGMKRFGALLTAQASKEELQAELDRVNELLNDSQRILNAVTKAEEKTDGTVDEQLAEANVA